jgi:hypothetical protein
VNLKKLILFLPFAVLLSCAHLLRYEEDGIDKELVGEIWKEVARLTKTDSDTSIPRIAFMENDLYHELKKLHCKFLDEAAKQECLLKREKIFQGLNQKYGKSVGGLYLYYLESEWGLAEDCSKYPKEKIKKCKEDQRKIYDTTALARIFFGSSRIEMYLAELKDNFRAYQNFHNQWFRGEEKVHFYGTVAHELLHYAYWKKGIDANEHHKLMKESKDLETILDLLSRRLEANPDSIHKYLHMRSLELGIEGDEAEKRIRERKKQEADVRRNEIAE